MQIINELDSKEELISSNASQKGSPRIVHEDGHKIGGSSDGDSDN